MAPTAAMGRHRALRPQRPAGSVTTPPATVNAGGTAAAEPSTAPLDRGDRPAERRADPDANRLPRTPRPSAVRRRAKARHAAPMGEPLRDSREPASDASAAGLRRAADRRSAAAPMAARVITRPARSDAMKDAERLLAQGDIAGACKKGEEQMLTPPRPRRRSTSSSASVTCARASPTKPCRTTAATSNCAPDAPDAAFIRSIVR